MIGQQAYIKAIKNALQIALCLRDFPSQLVQKDNKPYIELSGYKNSINSLILKPIHLSRSKKERFLIEPSINSCRISFTIKQNDLMDSLIAEKLAKMLFARADRFEILRRKPIGDYDLSFLITTEHLQTFEKQKLIQIIVELIETLQKDISQIKLNINTQCRIAATHFVSQLSIPK